MNNKLIPVFLIMVLALFAACSSIPKNTQPVSGFDAEKYLGVWYEIARLDHRFERNLNNVSAQYSLTKNGNIRVFNSGFDLKKEEWTSAEGEAKFREAKDIAALKVTFFKPFYSGYNVIAIDDDYQYALIAGANLKYLWILSRAKTIPDTVKNDYLNIAKEIGYDTSALIWVEHDKSNPLIQQDQ